MSSMTPTRRADLWTVALLAVATTLALAWANSPWHSSYGTLLHLGSGLDFGAPELSLDVHALVNDGLMAIFFLAIGLELKRELVVGELRDPKVAALPAAAAVGGMLVPAALYAAINAGSAGASGWGIPMATDIAFALGVVALVGSRLPPTVRLFLLTLAAVDDFGAIAVIAIWYSNSVSAPWLVAGGAMAMLIWIVHRSGVHAAPVHALLGLMLWYATFRSGIHPTIAGVVAGLLAPAAHPPVAQRWEHRIAPLVGFVIVPAFALVNAGVRIEVGVLGRGGPRLVAIGVVVGLVIGKFVGVLGAGWLAAHFTSAALPPGMTWRHVAGIGALAGMGFTVSLFVGDLAFVEDPRLEAAAKLGILAATVVAGVIGGIGLRSADRKATPDSPTPVQDRGRM